MNPDIVRFHVDIHPNFAYISIGGILVKIIFNKYIPLSLQEASNLIIKSNGDVIKCRYEPNNRYVLNCVERIRNGEELPTYTFQNDSQIQMFVQEKMNTFSEIRNALELINK